MANIFEPEPEQICAWDDWVKLRPEKVRALIEKHGFKPWKLYRNGPDGKRVRIHSFDEQTDGGLSLKVIVSGEFNFVAFERTVFGVPPEDLTECDLPGPDEKLGSVMPFDQHPLRGEG